MSPNSNEMRGICSCGQTVIFVYNGGSGTTTGGATHYCNGIITGNSTYEEQKLKVKTTFKNSQFFDKHRKQIGKYERKSFC